MRRTDVVVLLFLVGSVTVLAAEPVASEAPLFLEEVRPGLLSETTPDAAFWFAPAALDAAGLRRAMLDLGSFFAEDWTSRLEPAETSPALAGGGRFMLAAAPRMKHSRAGKNRPPRTLSILRGHVRVRVVPNLPLAIAPAMPAAKIRPPRPAAR